MKLTRDKYKQHLEDGSGLCELCEEITCEDVDLDAKEDKCPECGGESVVGMERALMYGQIEISDEESEDVEIISFSDEEE